MMKRFSKNGVKAAIVLVIVAFTPAAQAKMLWQGDFGTDWQKRWGVDRFLKPEAKTEIRADSTHGPYLRVTFPKDQEKKGLRFTNDLQDKIGSRDTVYLSYYLRFSPGFEWKGGGKLPGLMTYRGGSIGGCTPPTGTNGFSLRYMWSYEGLATLYPYLPPQLKYQPSKKGCARRYSLGTKFKTGRWQHLVQMVKLNTPGKPDGEIKVWLDGRLVRDFSGVMFRKNNFTVGGIKFSTFYGGCPNNRDCTPNKSGNYIDFASFSLHDAFPGRATANPTSNTENLPSTQSASGAIRIQGADMDKQGNVAKAGNSVVVLRSNKDSVSFTLPRGGRVSKNLLLDDITIKARGTNYEGMPVANVYLNGQKLRTLQISEQWRNYSINNVRLQKGDRLTIVYPNDKYSPGRGDRNLFIESVSIN